MLTKKDLEHLGELARLEIPVKDETKLLHDLEEILDYFKELKDVSTDKVKPLTGGMSATNILRADEITEERLPSGGALSQFPEKEGDFLKIPPVF
ncbi:MAG: Asp-tRNA(Asn)/Glu-tRNA(Gln) amidotransferase subunit GatC [Patescibacteria group bacterium]